jgi:hypothetical protein
MNASVAELGEIVGNVAATVAAASLQPRPATNPSANAAAAAGVTSTRAVAAAIAAAVWLPLVLLGMDMEKGDFNKKRKYLNVRQRLRYYDDRHRSVDDHQSQRHYSSSA